MDCISLNFRRWRFFWWDEQAAQLTETDQRVCSGCAIEEGERCYVGTIYHPKKWWKLLGPRTSDIYGCVKGAPCDHSEIEFKCQLRKLVRISKQLEQVCLFRICQGFMWWKVRSMDYIDGFGRLVIIIILGVRLVRPVLAEMWVMRRLTIGFSTEALFRFWWTKLTICPNLK